MVVGGRILEGIVQVNDTVLLGPPLISAPIACKVKNLQKDFEDYNSAMPGDAVSIHLLAVPSQMHGEDGDIKPLVKRRTKEKFFVQKGQIIIPKELGAPKFRAVEAIRATVSVVLADCFTKSGQMVFKGEVHKGFAGLMHYEETTTLCVLQKIIKSVPRSKKKKSIINPGRARFGRTYEMVFTVASPVHVEIFEKSKDRRKKMSRGRFVVCVQQHVALACVVRDVRYFGDTNPLYDGEAISVINRCDPKAVNIHKHTELSFIKKESKYHKILKK
mmetsp:Transcript_5892/g.6415  ORF Transcript_5892/g.6415 Transcript_5892/m.6415 type:complete len:274 (+) Transcript_5892:73-894(+)